MFNRRSKQKSEGFTLIELLVVIAIIGILAALLFPAIQGALLKANALKTGNAGKQMYIAIFDESTTREALNLPTVWPVNSPAASDYEPDFVAACANSTEFFKWLITADVLSGVDTAYFACPGLISQSDIDLFSENNNAWCVTTDLTEKMGGNTPFLFTKNFNLSGDLSTMDEADPLKSEPEGNEKMPFGGKLGIVITKGGAVKVLDLKFLKDENNSTKLGKELFNPPVTYAGTEYADGLPLGFLTPTQPISSGL